MLLVILAIACVFALELALRAKARNSNYYVFTPNRRMELSLDPLSHPNSDKLVRFDVNSRGERGGCRFEMPSSYQVLTVGGSAVECYFLDQDTSWPGCVDSLLSRPESLSQLGRASAHVGNIGRSGVDSKTLSWILERVLPKYDKLDLIILMTGANDILRWFENGAQSNLMIPLLKTEECFEQHPEIVFGWSPRKTAIAQTLRQLRARKIIKRTNVGSWVSRARKMRANAKEVRQFVGNPAAVYEMFEQGLSTAIRLCKTKASRVLVIHQPWFKKDRYSAEEQAVLWNCGVGRAYKDDISVYYSEQIFNSMMSELHSIASKVARDEDAEELDPMESMKPTLSNFVDMLHFTPLASKTFAKAIVNKILADAISKKPARLDKIAPSKALP